MCATGCGESPRVAVLALQGAFAEHEVVLAKLGVRWTELREAGDLRKEFDALILPGGESTVQAKLLEDLGMLAPLKARIEDGMPVLGTCAGAILLAEGIDEGKGSGSCSGGSPRGFATMPIRVRRNAYGRQLGSFRTEGLFACDKNPSKNGKIPMTFVRAPRIEAVGEGVEVLARVHGDIVAVRYGNQMALSFHPELDDDTSVHEVFLSLVR